MNILIIDATHGGVDLAVSFAKQRLWGEIYLYDVYNTLKPKEIKKLEAYNIKEFQDSSDSLLIVSPVHLPYTKEEILEKLKIKKATATFITHHEAVKILLNDFCQKHPEILKIEVTGVKGKTSSVFMLKNILKDKNPLILTSLGAILCKKEKEMILQKNISITPANIKKTVDLAYKVDNPICDIAKGKIEKTDIVSYKSMIFESSLGATGIGDVGLLTNIAENYPIAKNKSNARNAKAQVFKCSKIAIKKETLDKYYPNEDKTKINTFSIADRKANVYAKEISYGARQTSIKITYNNLKTINGNVIKGEFNVSTFAIGPHHVENVLGVICTSLTSEISEKTIVNGLKEFKGIEGRSYLRELEDCLIIEEVNPGINTKAIEYSIDMLKNPKEVYIIIGGDYGITCEEIDENKVAKLLNSKKDLNIILTGSVGKAIYEKMNFKPTYIQNPHEAIEIAVANHKNALFIYRSDYRNLAKR